MKPIRSFLSTLSGPTVIALISYRKLYLAEKIAKDSDILIKKVQEKSDALLEKEISEQKYKTTLEVKATNVAYKNKEVSMLEEKAKNLTSESDIKYYKNEIQRARDHRDVLVDDLIDTISKSNILEIFEKIFNKIQSIFNILNANSLLSLDINPNNG